MSYKQYKHYEHYRTLRTFNPHNPGFTANYNGETAERASASRLIRDAARALATGRVALASENPSQGRRSLSRFLESGPQGFWPVELNYFGLHAARESLGANVKPPLILISSS